MSASHRRSVNAEAIAPWVALVFVLLMWWAGARAVSWLRPHAGMPPVVRRSAEHASAAAVRRPLDTPKREAAVSAAPRPGEPAIGADRIVTDTDLADLRGRSLLIPVRGVAAADLVSSFSDARSGHTHEAIDILAPRGTEVLAVEDGTIAKLFTSAAGGLTIYQFDADERFVYYYAHLDRYAAGVHEGLSVTRGDVIGYVGTTGNAPPDTPHLHFAIAKLDPDRHWWGGTALDPFLVWRG